MKKILCLLMLCILALSGGLIVGCKNNDNQQSSEPPTPTLQQSAIVNGIEYEILESIADHELGEFEYGYDFFSKYTIQVRITVTNTTNENFTISTSSFKIISNNNEVTCPTGDFKGSTTFGISFGSGSSYTFTSNTTETLNFTFYTLFDRYGAGSPGNGVTQLKNTIFSFCLGSKLLFEFTPFVRF